MNQGYFPKLINVKNLAWGKIQDLYFQILSDAPSPVSAIPLERERSQKPEKDEPTRDSEEASQEVSK
jgi:hypothetical protein